MSLGTNDLIVGEREASARLLHLHVQGLAAQKETKNQIRDDIESKLSLDRTQNDCQKELERSR